MLDFSKDTSNTIPATFTIAGIVNRFGDDINAWIERALPGVIAHRTGMIGDKKEITRIEGLFRFEILQMYQIITSKDFKIERLSDFSTLLTRWQDVLFTPEEIVQLQTLINEGNGKIDTAYQTTEKHRNLVSKVFDSLEQDALTFTRPIRNLLRDIRYRTYNLLENMHY